VLSGGLGDDSISGQGWQRCPQRQRGDDTLSGGWDRRYAGGLGLDLVDYSDKFGALISIDGLATTGRLGENENVPLDVEAYRRAIRRSHVGSALASVLDGTRGRRHHRKAWPAMTTIDAAQASHHAGRRWAWIPSITPRTQTM